MCDTAWETQGTLSSLEVYCITLQLPWYFPNAKTTQTSIIHVGLYCPERVRQRGFIVERVCVCTHCACVFDETGVRGMLMLMMMSSG